MCVRRLVRDKTVVGLCSIGKENDSDPCMISFYTGVDEFAPKILEEAVTIYELEPFHEGHQSSKRSLLRCQHQAAWLPQPRKRFQ